jgi:hypothetical protein
VLLFKKAYWEGLASGAITLTFRRWDKAHVKAGGRYRCHPIGVLEVDAVTRVKVGDLTAPDAKRAGFPSRAALIAYLAERGPLDGGTELFRVELHHGGDGDRVASALQADLGEADLEAIAAKLARLDGAAPFSAATLALIEQRPRVAASKLAAELGRETAPFKADVVKLKKLGLTQSFEVGYELTPRGRAFVDARRAKEAPGAPNTRPQRPRRAR